MLYLEKVFFDIHKQLLNRKEVISLIFRLKTLRIYLKYFIKHYHSIKINVFYDKRKYENPLKIKFPHLTCCVDNDRQEKIEYEIFNYENEQLEDAYFKIIYWVIDAIDVKYTKKNRIKNNIFPDHDSLCVCDFDYDSDSAPDLDNDPDCYYDSDYEYDLDYNPDCVYDLDYDYDYD